MTRIRVTTVIRAPRRHVWAAIRDVARHVDWMEDAVAIRFTSPRRSGVGATFDCDTRVGPLRLTDRMEVTEWKEGRVMGIRHVGVVTGTAVTTEGSAHASSRSDSATRDPPRCPRSWSAAATPPTTSSATEATVKRTVTWAAFQNRGSAARKA